MTGQNLNHADPYDRLVSCIFVMDSVMVAIKKMGDIPKTRENTGRPIVR